MADEQRLQELSDLLCFTESGTVTANGKLPHLPIKVEGFFRLAWQIFASGKSLSQALAFIGPGFHLVCVLRMPPWL